MRRRTVVFSPEARDDVLALYERVTGAAGADVALAYVERIEAYCNGLDLAAERGRLRDGVRPGLRIIGFERRVMIAFTVDAERVTILRGLAAGRDWTLSL